MLILVAICAICVSIHAFLMEKAKQIQMICVETPFLASADGGHGKPCPYDYVALFSFVYQVCASQSVLISGICR